MNEEDRRTIVIAAHDVGGQGGMELHLEEMITRLKRRARVIVVAHTMKLRDPEGVRFIRVPAIARPVPLKILLFAVTASIRLLFLKRDMLHTTGAILFNRADYSTVHFCHDGYLKATGDTRSNRNHSLLHRLNSALASRIALTMERMIYRPSRTKKLIAVSSRVKDELLAAYPYSPDQVHVVPNGVDVRNFVPLSPERKLELRERYSLPLRERILLFMGGDWSRKGLDLAIDAFNAIAGDYPEAHLLVVGAGDEQLYREYVALSYRHRIRFAGKQSNPQDWLGLADILLAPSSYETFSLVVHEAAAAGLAILATRVGGVEEFIEHEVNGYYVERNADSIAMRLRSLLTDDENARLCGQNARSKVEDLTWDHAFRKMAEIYRLAGDNRMARYSGSGSKEFERYPSENL